MRGGTCYCCVIISDDTIGTPVVHNPDVLIAFNEPSYTRFEPAIKPGGLLIADSSMLISGVRSSRSDITAYYPPAAQLANENDILGLGNLIIIGKMLAETGIFSAETIEKAMHMAVPNAEGNEKALLRLENNMKAIALGQSL
jgi:2-oxoglutarate ferredoxin oxidoreductase subunit gamma